LAIITSFICLRLAFALAWLVFMFFFKDCHLPWLPFWPAFILSGGVG
jgi:hypothetical protein